MQSKGRLLLFLAFLSAIIPVMLMRDFTPGNELRYLSIADEALRDHHFFAFYNHGLAYADKPPLYEGTEKVPFFYDQNGKCLRFVTSLSANRLK